MGSVEVAVALLGHGTAGSAGSLVRRGGARPDVALVDRYRALLPVGPAFTLARAAPLGAGAALADRVLVWAEDADACAAAFATRYAERAALGLAVSAREAYA